MTASFPVAALLMMQPVGVLRLGPMRLTPYGLCAAVGLVLAMALALRCAVRVGMRSETAWDAGLFAIISCFVASRLLLVLFDLRAFTRYPLLVLSLPSLTYMGMALAVVMVWIYLRRKRLPVLTMLDIFAAPAALLACGLELGHALDGSEVGMPTRLPWAVRDPWSEVPVRVHPVALYGVAAALVLAAVLWRMLFSHRERGGRVAAAGLGLGAAAAFGLEMLTQPAPALVDPGVEPGQWVALAAMAAGALLWSFAPLRSLVVKSEPQQIPSEFIGTSCILEEQEPERTGTEVR